jgi:hypothetical protein
VTDGQTHTIRQILKSEDVYQWNTVVETGAAFRIDIKGDPSKGVEVRGVSLDETIILDGANKIISVVPSDDIIAVGDRFNFNWLPLAAGDNEITITGNCDVQIRWIEPRKVGSL